MTPARGRSTTFMSTVAEGPGRWGDGRGERASGGAAAAGGWGVSLGLASASDADFARDFAKVLRFCPARYHRRYLQMLKHKIIYINYFYNK